MNEFKIFTYQQKLNVRTVIKDGELWFVGKDVCIALGYANPRKAIDDHVYEEDKYQGDGVTIRDSIGRSQTPTIINESGVYALVFGSNLPSAKEFKHWITHEVLPTIRKTGGYVANDELFVNTYLSGADDATKLLFKGTLEAVRKMNAENDKLKLENAQKTQIIGELQPKADYCDEILKSKNLVTVTQIAKDYGMAASVFNEMLHKFGVQFKQNNQWLLYSKYHNCGYTKSVTVSFDRHGETDSQMYTKWTQKGRLFLYEELKKHGVYPLIERNEVSA